MKYTHRELILSSYAFHRALQRITNSGYDASCQYWGTCLGGNWKGLVSAASTVGEVDIHPSFNNLQYCLQEEDITVSINDAATLLLAGLEARNELLTEGQASNRRERICRAVISRAIEELELRKIFAWDPNGNEIIESGEFVTQIAGLPARINWAEIGYSEIRLTVIVAKPDHKLPKSPTDFGFKRDAIFTTTTWLERLEGPYVQKSRYLTYISQQAKGLEQLEIPPECQRPYRFVNTSWH
ncbi:MAG: hypothetical protein IT489_03895 [Gammaproteobacteria bacterium]|nr:hypothetical protein [Gammaproteobacteria bacterium]